MLRRFTQQFLIIRLGASNENLMDVVGYPHFDDSKE